MCSAVTSDPITPRRSRPVQAPRSPDVDQQQLSVCGWWGGEAGKAGQIPLGLSPACGPAGCSAPRSPLQAGMPWLLLHGGRGC